MTPTRAIDSNEKAVRRIRPVSSLREANEWTERARIMHTSSTAWNEGSSEARLERWRNEKDDSRSSLKGRAFCQIAARPSLGATAPNPYKEAKNEDRTGREGREQGPGIAARISRSNHWSNEVVLTGETARFKPRIYDGRRKTRLPGSNWIEPRGLRADINGNKRSVGDDDVIVDRG